RCCMAPAVLLGLLYGLLEVLQTPCAGVGMEVQRIAACSARGRIDLVLLLLDGAHSSVPLCPHMATCSRSRAAAGCHTFVVCRPNQPSIPSRIANSSTRRSSVPSSRHNSSAAKISRLLASLQSIVSSHLLGPVAAHDS